MEKGNAGAAGSREAARNIKYIIEGEDYLDSLIDKLASLGLAEESYADQLSDRLEPILGELYDR